MSLYLLAFLVSIGTVIGLVKLTTSAIEGNESETQSTDNSSLTVDVSSTELTIELADEPVFAVLPVELTVAEATEAGYTLTAYAESTDLVSATDSSKVIPMIAVDEGELAVLTDNTYGLALAEPASQAEEVFTALSTDADNPTLLAEKEEATANKKAYVYSKKCENLTEEEYDSFIAKIDSFESEENLELELLKAYKKNSSEIKPISYPFLRSLRSALS